MIPKQTNPNIPDAGTIFSEQRFQSAGSQALTIHTLSYGAREPGFFFPGESHEAAELVWLDRGTLHTVTDGAEALLQPGELILYGPDRWHTHFAEPEESPRFLNITFTCAMPLPEGLFGHKLPVSSASEGLFRQFLQELQAPDRFSGDMIPLLLQQLLVVLQREEIPGQTFSPIHNENEIILRAQRYIAAQVRQKLSVPLVARNIGVSPSYLTALFHKHLRIAPAEYIRRTKLQESKRLIRESGLTFTEIAAALQYSTVHHFSRQFKEKFGITPTEYAKSVGAIPSNN